MVVGDGAVVVRWSVGAAGGELMLAANLSNAPVGGFPPATGSVLWREGEPDHPSGQFGSWSVRWSLSETDAEGTDLGLAEKDARQRGDKSPERSGNRG
jgi:hypothetical protein